MDQSHFIVAADGLRLHARVHGARNAALPVVCLPGLTRTAEDFDDLARALAGDAARPRRVLALDYRGRGLSGYDDPKNYNVAVELNDVIAVVTALAASPAVYIGTSRGGILTMLLAAAQPQMVAGAVLNDIGPVIEPQGLVRIKSYVGQIPLPANFDEGAATLRALFADQFPRLTEADWLAAARRAWRMDGGNLVPTHDQRLTETLKHFDPAQPLQTMWEAFDALARVPLMAIRGGLSDLLSAETLRAMQARHPAMEVVEVADQGHPVILSGPDMTRRIADFIARCEARQGVA